MSENLRREFASEERTNSYTGWLEEKVIMFRRTLQGRDDYNILQAKLKTLEADLRKREADRKYLIQLIIDTDEMYCEGCVCPSENRAMLESELLDNLKALRLEEAQDDE